MVRTSARRFTPNVVTVSAGLSIPPSVVATLPTMVPPMVVPVMPPVVASPITPPTIVPLKFVPVTTTDTPVVAGLAPKPVPGSDEISRLVRDMTPEQMARQILSLELDGIMRKIQAIELRVTQELNWFAEIINQQMVSDKFSIARKVNRALWIQDKIAKFNFTNLAELQDLMSKAQRYSSALGV